MLIFLKKICLCLLLISAFPGFVFADNSPQPLTVMSSYPATVIERMQAAFEKAHPDIRMNVIWRMPQDALPYLQQAEQGGVDVYWAASTRTFDRLKSDGALRKLEANLASLPTSIGNTSLRDSDLFFVATEMAGFGFAINNTALATLGITSIKTWQDLTNPALSDNILLPNPARVGFAPVLIDIPLQGFGWEKGWALWSAISGNATLIEQGGGFISERITSGEAAVGLSIDFFITSAIANGAPISFVYPDKGGINPAHIAITSSSQQLNAARKFVDFVLSAEGQQLLAHSDIRKLPVRPEVYKQLPDAYYRPFAAAGRHELDYDNDKGRSRLGVISALFNHHLVYRHSEQRQLWQQLHKLEAEGKPQAQLRQLLTKVPLDESHAASEELQQHFRNRLEGATPGMRAIEQQWRSETDQRIAAAQALLDVL